MSSTFFSFSHFYIVVLSINIFKLCDALDKSNPICIKIQRLSSAFLEKNEVYKDVMVIE
ncbi:MULTISPECIES: hypothetical protein [Acinetobacter]|uniref:hypothetical protein n=1 Tax=Acinetobacter TaxID=469 RepID=UPI000B2BBBE5|nr:MULTISPECIES: hypothetical protein [Acinetobacter]